MKRIGDQWNVELPRRVRRWKHIDSRWSCPLPLVVPDRERTEQEIGEHADVALREWSLAGPLLYRAPRMVTNRRNAMLLVGAHTWIAGRNLTLARFLECGDIDAASRLGPAGSRRPNVRGRRGGHLRPPTGARLGNLHLLDRDWPSDGRTFTRPIGSAVNEDGGAASRRSVAHEAIRHRECDGSPRDHKRKG